MSYEDQPTGQLVFDSGWISVVPSMQVVGLWPTKSHKSWAGTRSVNKWIVRLKHPCRALEDLFLVPRNIFLSWTVRWILWRPYSCAVMFQHTICKLAGAV